MVSVSADKWMKREVTFEIGAITGGSREIIESLNRSLGGYSGKNREIYIGIASGKDAFKAMDRRFDKKKWDWKINRMVCIFSSSSQSVCRKVEEKLIDAATKRYGRKRDGGRVLNTAGGGGGADSAGPRYFVYVAIAG